MQPVAQAMAGQARPVWATDLLPSSLRLQLRMVQDQRSALIHCNSKADALLRVVVTHGLNFPIVAGGT